MRNDAAVLIIDDDPDLLSSVSSLLHSMNYGGSFYASDGDFRVRFDPDKSD